MIRLVLLLTLGLGSACRTVPCVAASESTAVVRASVAFERDLIIVDEFVQNRVSTMQEVDIWRNARDRLLSTLRTLRMALKQAATQAEKGVKP